MAGETKAIRYIGGKPGGDWDHNYGSGVRWEKKGDVQQVPLAAALKLLKHPEYEEVIGKGQSASADEPKVVQDKKPDDDETQQAPLISLESSTKAQIVTYAKRNFGVDLDPASKKDALVDRVRNLMNGVKSQ